MIILYQRTHLTLLTTVMRERVKESKTTINWFKANHLIVNPKKFQPMLVSKRKNTMPVDFTYYNNNVDIKPKNSVKLLGVTLDKKTKF